MPGAANQSLAHRDGTYRQTRGTANLVYGPNGQNKRRMGLYLSCAQAVDTTVHHALRQVGSLLRWRPDPWLIGMGACTPGCGVEAGWKKKGVLIFELDLERSVPS